MFSQQNSDIYFYQTVTEYTFFKRDWQHFFPFHVERLFIQRPASRLWLGDQVALDNKCNRNYMAGLFSSYPEEAKQLLDGCWLIPPSKCRQNIWWDLIASWVLLIKRAKLGSYKVAKCKLCLNQGLKWRHMKWKQPLLGLLRLGPLNHSIWPDKQWSMRLFVFCQYNNFFARCKSLMKLNM